MTNCQSIFVTKHGAPDVLQFKSDQIDDPNIGDVCVKISYTGINFADLSCKNYAEWIFLGSII